MQPSDRQASSSSGGTSASMSSRPAGGGGGHKSNKSIDLMRAKFEVTPTTPTSSLSRQDSTAIGRSPALEGRMASWRVAQERSMAESAKAPAPSSPGVSRAGTVTSSIAAKRASFLADTAGSSFNAAAASPSTPTTASRTGETSLVSKRFSAFEPMAKVSSGASANGTASVTTASTTPKQENTATSVLLPAQQPRPRSWVPKKQASREALRSIAGAETLAATKASASPTQAVAAAGSSKTRIAPPAPVEIVSEQKSKPALSTPTTNAFTTPAASPLPVTPRVAAINSDQKPSSSSPGRSSPFGVTTELDESDPVQRRLAQTAEDLRRREREIDETLARLLGRPMPDEDGSAPASTTTTPRSQTTMSSSKSFGQPYYPNPEPIRRPRGEVLQAAPKTKLDLLGGGSAESDAGGLDSQMSSLGLEKGSHASVSKATSSSSTTPGSQASAPGLGRSSANKYGGVGRQSLGKTDGRQLGKHLPRITSGKGPEEARAVSSLKDTTGSPDRSKLSVPTVVRSETRRAMEKVSPPSLANRFQSPASAAARLRPDGLGMQGLTGKNVAKLPPAPTSSAVAPAPLPSKRLNNTTWMDKQRKAVGAYEYLCHVGEAQQWIEGCLGEELGFGVTEMEDGIRDGVALAKLARIYQGESVVRHIWEDEKHRFRQSDNIVHFLNFVRSIGMPETFIFETTDLYNKKNVPKVIYCIHILSHLLARLGKANRIGNLVGQFDFTDEQLASTQKGLQGVAMPNFGGAGNALAKEADLLVEEEPESEEEMRDRLLLECEGDIRKLQAILRGHLARQRLSLLTSRLALTTVSVQKLQSRARGALVRQRLTAEKKARAGSTKWIIALQAAARQKLAQDRRKRLQSRLAAIRVVGLQAQCRGALARKQARRQKNYMQAASVTVVAIQAQIRGVLARRRKAEFARQVRSATSRNAVAQLQARARGGLVRNQTAALVRELHQEHVASFTGFQAAVRGALVRAKLRRQVRQLDDSATIVVAIQAAARSYLARQDKIAIQAVFHPVEPAIIGLQALARARLAMRSHAQVQKALNKVEVSSAVGGLQAMLRSRLAKRSNVEQKKQLEFVAPDVIGFQSLARGVLARRDYNDWLQYLRDEETQLGITFLQRLLRGRVRRNQFKARWYDLHANVHNIIKCQAMWRGRRERLRFGRLISGSGVDVPTLQHFMHLLDDSENDFNEENQIESLRKQVVQIIRDNQLLEGQVAESDTKIALLLQNRLSFEDLVKVKGITGHVSSASEEESFKVAHQDPFSHAAQLDKTMRRRLELYQHLFFLLQTDPKYLARLMRLESERDAGMTERKKMLQGVILASYGYGSGRREEFLLMKVLQLAVHEQVLAIQSLEELTEKQMIATEVAIAFARPKHPDALKTMLGKALTEMVNAPDLDLCIDPVSIYHRILNDEESESGVISAKPRDVDAYFAVMKDTASSAAFFQQMASLQHWTSVVLEALYLGTDSIPYALRWMAREMLLSLRVKTQYAVEDYELTPIIAMSVILPYLSPVLSTPDAYKVLPAIMGALPRQNLGEVLKLLICIACGHYRKITHDVHLFAPLEQYIAEAVPGFSEWILDIASVDDVQSHLRTQDLVEVAAEPKPVTLSRAEIYGMHSLLSAQLDDVAAADDDPVRKILAELGGVPNVLYQEGQSAPVTLVLGTRFAEVVDDPFAAQKADWSQAKRHALATLKVQTAKTLIDVLTMPVYQEDEEYWLAVVQFDIDSERAKNRKSRLPLPPTVSDEYRLEDIRSLEFREVKARAIQFCMKMEKEGMLSREDNWQGLLDDIAADIRSKNQNRQRRRKDYAALTEAMAYATDKKGALQEQLLSYNAYVTSAMNTMQKQGKKKFVMPFSKQGRHLRSMQKQGKKAQFGSYKYSAAQLYEEHVLLPISTFSPAQFGKLSVIISSNEVGVFDIEIVSPGSAQPVLGSCQVRMEDLLQAKYENRTTLDMFDQVAKVRVNTLIFLINKKFYS